MSCYLLFGLTIFLSFSCTGQRRTSAAANTADLMQADMSEVPSSSSSFSCSYPCRCPNNTTIDCPKHINLIKDGCNCCYMCARQRGDLCDMKDACDKNLKCDYIRDNGLRGYCKDKEAKPCAYNGESFKDGEEVRKSCRELCTCQNGFLVCVNKCPQEEVRPGDIHCHNPALVAVRGQCCKEWVCGVPYSSLPDYVDSGDDDDAMPDHAHVTNVPQAGCEVVTSAWSSCSKSCGMGVSTRTTNQNYECKLITEKRLCIIRPCNLNDKHRTGKDCKSTWKASFKKIEYRQGSLVCESVKNLRAKYCSTCKEVLKKCCVPERTKTINLLFKCNENLTKEYPFQLIIACACYRKSAPECLQ